MKESPADRDFTKRYRMSPELAPPSVLVTSELPVEAPKVLAHLPSKTVSTHSWSFTSGICSKCFLLSVNNSRSTCSSYPHILHLNELSLLLLFCVCPHLLHLRLVFFGSTCTTSVSFFSLIPPKNRYSLSKYQT